MKIIGTDNLAREDVSDILWTDGLPNTAESKHCAEIVCERLNRGLGGRAGTYYKVVSDNYKLYEFDGY